MDSYSFVVRDTKEIDLPRVAEENKDAEAILVISGNALLMLSTEFLSKFEYDDNLLINIQPLTKVCGERKVAVLYNDNAAWFRTGSYETSIEVPGYRFIAIEKHSIRVIKRQLEAARNFERKFFIRVKTL